MPEMPFAVPDDTPLFPEDDPLVITIPGAKGAEEGTPEAGGKFVCLDASNAPLERDVDPSQKPIEWTIQLLALQVIPEQRDAFEAAIVDAVRSNRIKTDGLVDVARWVNEQRREAEKAATSRTVDRPTKARARSTR